MPTQRHFYPQPLQYLTRYLDKLVKGRLWLKVSIGMLLGIITGILLGPAVGMVEPRIASTIGNWMALPGQLFLILIQMIVMPLVFASVIRGLAAGENLEQLRVLESGRIIAVGVVENAAVGIDTPADYEAFVRRAA